MSKLLLTTALLLSSSSYAFAGHESYGGGFCSFANVVCITPGDNSKQGAVELCMIDNGKENVAYVSVEHDGSTPSHAYKVERMPMDRHRLGSPVRYEGEDFSLSIGATTSPTPIGQYSTLTIEDLGLSDKVVYCKFQR